MIKIELSKRFRKQVACLLPKQQAQLYKRLRIFVENPWATILRTHPLKGALIGRYSFSISGDMRVHFRWKDRERTSAFLITIGTHAELYS